MRLKQELLTQGYRGLQDSTAVASYKSAIGGIG